MLKLALSLALFLPAVASANPADDLLKQGMSYDPVFAAAKPDLKKAFELYKRAAEMGSPEAMYRVYEAYRTPSDRPDNPTAENKYGVAPDPIEAYAWISLACDYCEDSRMKVYTEAKTVADWQIRYYELKKANNAPIPAESAYAASATKKYKALKAKMDEKLKK